ncbi:hypothetical protein [Desulfurobacterium sp.]
MIYGSTSVIISQEILNKCYEENEYIQLSESYFLEIKENKSFEKSDIVLKDIENLRFYQSENSIASDFKVIEELPIYQDLFIEINETAKRIYEKFEKEVIKEEDFLRRLENYHKLKKNFKKYIISVPSDFIKYAVNTEIFPKIPLENLDDYYDKGTIGFKRIKTDEILIF